MNWNILLSVFFSVCSFTIAQSQTVNFTASTTGGCSPLLVTFTDSSTGNPTGWYWDFGNGATSTLKNPSTTYFATGNFTVSLTVTYADGTKSVTYPNFVTIYQKPVVNFVASDSVGCSPLLAQFTENASVGVGTRNVNWLWDFGDGTQSTEQNPVKRYTDPGTYTISLRVTNDKGCWGVTNKNSYIKVTEGVKAAFSFPEPDACKPPFPVSFTNLSSGPGMLQYQWSFGDGTVSTSVNPTHIYQAPGIYNVDLSVKNTDGCVDTVRQQVSLNPANATSALASPDSVCINDTVRFRNLSSFTPSAVQWNFGDGTNSNEWNPVKFYNRPGNFTIKLIQQNGSCSDTAQKNISVLARPAARFTASTFTSCKPPLTVSFQNNSPDAVRFEWDFGDSTFSTERNPSHTYTAYGNFTVRLKVTNATGCTDFFTMPEPVSIAKPQISFAAVPSRGCLPLNVQFSPNVTTPDPVVSYLWDFGDGTTSSQQNPSHLYTTQGSFSSSLTIRTAAGCSEKYVVTDAVLAGTKPKANFSAAPNPVCAFRSVAFTNLTPEGTNWFWDFGDGNTSTSQHPLYAYNDTGVFSVKLIAENYGCRDSLLLKDFITIKPPIALFIYQADCNNKFAYTFTNQSIGANTWQWNFGDGTTSTQQNPSHLYTRAGAYLVTLTVGNDTCFNTIQTTVNVSDGIPNFRATQTIACKGTSLQLTADSTNAANIVSYAWDFGDGATFGTGATTSITYQKAGRYTIRLTTTDVNGCTETVVKPQYLQINGPTAGFAATDTTGCKGLQTTFTDASANDGSHRIVAWNWNFGDSTSLTQLSNNPIRHTYATAGNFDVRLQVTDQAGCSDVLQIPAFIKTSFANASFNTIDTLSCPGASISFNNTSTAQTPFSSAWYFGNGQQSAVQDPTTVYNAIGKYTVKLSITDQYGCTDSVIKANFVTINRPVAAFRVNDTASACVPFQVYYTNTSTFYSQQVWDLAGGTTRLANPTQFYNAPGVYQTKLVVTSPGGCTDSAFQTIRVYDVRSTQIRYQPLAGCKPLFVDLATVHPVQLNTIWDMGDGTIVNSRDSVQKHVYRSFGDFIPKIILTDSSGCVVPIIGQDTIRIKGATAYFGLDNKLFCDSGTVRFTDSTTANNPITSYTWNFGDGTTSSSFSPQYHYSKPGNYSVSLQIRTQNNCVDTFRLPTPIKVVASPAIAIGGDSVICAGGSLSHLALLQRSDTSRLSWSWQFPNGQSSAAQAPQAQVYPSPVRGKVQLVATNSTGCSDTAYLALIVHPLPTVQLPTTITTLLGTPVVLPALYSDSIQRYQWREPEGLSCTACPQPIALPRWNTTYQVEVTNNNGCRNTGEVQVIVLCSNNNVFIPNTFSPNGDGSNDVFYIRGQGLSRVKSLRIFNRWGQVVFERMNFNVNDASAGWDGTFRDAKPVPDVYVYQAEIYCDNSQVVKLEGNVALIQ